MIKHKKGLLETAQQKRPQFGTANPEPVSVAAAPGKRLIGPKDLPMKGIAYNINHLRRMWNAGKFPAPVYTSERRFAWREADLDQWIESRLAKVG